MKLNRITLSLNRDGGLKKFFLIMKLTWAFILILNLQMSASVWSQTTTMSVKLKNSTLQELFTKIEKSSEYRFFYNNDEVDVNQRISANAEDKTIGAILETALKGLPYSFKESENKLIIIERTGEVTNPSGTNVQQGKKVSGKITDSNGGSLPGVSVVVKGTTTGVITDSNGNYSLANVSENATLQFSFVGMKTQEILVGTQNSINIVLSEETIGLEEVVAVGYGTQRKRDVTGSITSINSEKIRLIPVNSPDQSIQGRVSGVQVVQTSGAPGGAVQIRIRGVNSTAGGGANQPLYVVDGIPLVYNEGINSLSVGNEGSSGGAGSNSASPLSSISPNDIESIEVLKDASATAIYGARAANGVVIITTKTGKIGKPQISLNVSYGVQSLREKIPVTNGKERAAMVFEHRRNAGTRGNEVYDIWAINPFLISAGTDWQNEVFVNAPIANYNLGISGGTEKITYAISGDYMDQQGILMNTYSKKTGLKVNLDVKANDKMKFGTRTNVGYQWENGAQNDEFFQGILNGLTQISPLLPVYDATGNFAGRPNNLIGAGFFGDGGANAVANMQERIRNAKRYRLISSVFGEYNILSNLKFKTSFGVDYLFTDLRQVDPYWVRGADINTPVRVTESSPKTFNWVAEQTLTYDKLFGKHALNVVAGFSAQKVSIKSLGVSANGSVSNALNQLGNMPTVTSGYGGLTEQGLVSQFIRANYSFMGRYLLTGTIRRDGSSKFGSNNKYGLFPSASLGWRLSEENFLKDSKLVSNLKVRASYGSTGNQNIGDFLYSALMGGNTAIFGNAAVSGLAPNRFQNNDIRWERNDQLDIGLDIGLFNNRINMTMDYYDKRTKGLLAGAPMSVISGVGNAYTTNIGEIKNSGFEFAINSDVVKSEDFKWNVDFNIATNKNEVVSLGNLPYLNGASVSRIGSFINRTEPGHPIGAFYILQTSGQYQTWAEAATAPTYKIAGQPYFAPGDFIPVDQNKDGLIDDLDRVWSGSPFPDFFGGFTSTFTYKNWSLSIFAPFQQGNKIWNQPFLGASTFEGNTWRSIYDNRWKPSNAGTVTSIPVPRNNNPIMPVPFYLQDGSFVRIRTISLSYEVPVAKLSFVKLSRLNVYVQANNMFVLTKYEGWDPEVNSFGSNVTTNGIDIGAYPQAKSIIFGANIGF